MKLKIHNKKLLSMLLAGSMVLTGCSLNSSIDGKNFEDIISDVSADYVVDDYLLQSEVEIDDKDIDLVEATTKLEELVNKFSKIRDLKDISILAPNNECYSLYKDECSKWDDEYIDNLIDDFNSEDTDKVTKAFNKLSSYKTYLNDQFRDYGLSTAHLLLVNSIKGVSIDAISNDREDVFVDLEDYDSLELRGYVNSDDSKITIVYDSEEYDFYNSDAYKCIEMIEGLIENSNKIYYEKGDIYYDDGNIFADTCTEALDYSKRIISKEARVSNNKIKKLK